MKIENYNCASETKLAYNLPATFTLDTAHFPLALKMKRGL